MCKVLMISGIKKKNIEKAWKFARAMAGPMSQSNTDGLGYAAITAEGKLFGERWLNNDDAFKKVVKPDVSKLDQELLQQFEGVVEQNPVNRITDETVYNSFGDIDLENAVSITMHTRMATSAKGMINVHPFVDEGVSLIHNGVIRNVDEFKLRVSSCDSEAILQAYLAEKVKDDPTQMTAAAKKLRGYYACGVLANTEAGPILDIFKMHGASLHAARIEELEAYVISTSENDIKRVCHHLGWKMGNVYSIHQGKLIRMNAITGERILFENFEGGTEYNYGNNNYGGYHNSPRNSGTSTKSGNTSTSTGTNTSLPAGKSTNEKVIPLNKKKANVVVTDPKGLMLYIDSGKPTCVKLNERSVQEEIMKLGRA